MKIIAERKEEMKGKGRINKGGVMNKLLILVMLLISTPAFADQYDFAAARRQSDEALNQQLRQMRSDMNSNTVPVRVQIVDQQGRGFYRG